MSERTGSIEEAGQILYALGAGMCETIKLKYFDMRNRMMYIGKPQIIVEQQLFHNNNLTFNTLTSKI
ncbi:hypothetical protein [Chitinophaga agri]|uniref:hypothetical protein n=1 Tax=Chitinophaga agri TaxID=2703787 RepID=UPI001EE44847|nr:hypothetical protein [Chitinophaga agri]